MNRSRKGVFNWNSLCVRTTSLDQSTNDKQKHDEGSETGGEEKDDDVSSTTVDYLPGEHIKKANAEALDHRVGRKTLSIDQ